MSVEPPFDPHDRLAVLRILDANANRAAEGLRVVEEYARFVLADPFQAGRWKSLRHELTAALATLPPSERLAARDTAADVGVGLETPAEYRRIDSADVATANLARAQQALRSLEEYGKAWRSDFARAVERLRYQSYVLGAALLRVSPHDSRLAGRALYVLVDGGVDAEDFERRCRAVLAGGAGVVQLRDKRLDDRDLLERARRLRAWTRASDVLLIVNDRPDLARLADADGVHVGQTELRVRDARAIMGPRALIGVSTHAIDQARQAVLDGADYLGCGPTFASSTKAFERFAGLDYLREVAAEIRTPAYAIGGVRLENLDQLLAAGATRVAVSDAVWRADDPTAAARAFVRKLTTAPA